MLAIVLMARHSSSVLSRLLPLTSLAKAEGFVTKACIYGELNSPEEEENNARSAMFASWKLRERIC